MGGRGKRKQPIVKKPELRPDQLVLTAFHRAHFVCFIIIIAAVRCGSAWRASVPRNFMISSLGCPILHFIASREVPAPAAAPAPSGSRLD